MVALKTIIYINVVPSEANYIYLPFENHILDFGIVYVDSLLFPPSMSIEYRALLPKLCYSERNKKQNSLKLRKTLNLNDIVFISL